MVFLAAMAMLGIDVNGVPAARLEWLKEGINSSHYLAQSFQGYNDAHYSHYMQGSDWDLVKKAGFRHVRLTINPIVVTGDAMPNSTLTPNGLKVLDGVVTGLVKRKLGVVVDIHPDDSYKEAISKDPKLGAAFVTFWGNLAAHLKGTDPNKVVFEVMNEPNFLSGDTWRSLQGRAIQAIRKVAPKHTIIVNPGKWSGKGDLLEMKPYSSKNLVYTWHNYDPFIFTHQGAEWGWDKSKLMKRVPYPSTPEAVNEMIGTVHDDVAIGALKQYGQDRWGAAKVAAGIQEAADWGKKNGVPVYCGEFGSYRAYVDPEARLRWLTDMSAGLRKADVGWAMWDYAGGFAVAVGDEGKRTLDMRTVKALGLGR